MDLSYCLLAVDLDGTLLNSRNESSSRNRDALRRAHEAGLIICLCTGRSLTEAEPVIDQIGLDLNAGVFVFGALVADLAAGSTLFRHALPAETAERLISHLREREHPVLALYDPKETGCDYVLIEGRRNQHAYERWLAFTPTRTERATEWQPRECPPLRLAIIEDPGRINQTLAELREQFGPGQAKINSIYAPNYGLHVVECFAPMVNKWYAVSKLAERLNVPGSQVAAVGDDINDLEMIESAGLGVAMGNAIPAIKRAARRQVPPNDKDGVSVLIDSLLGCFQSSQR